MVDHHLVFVFLLPQLFTNLLHLIPTPKHKLINCVLNFFQVLVICLRRIEIDLLLVVHFQHFFAGVAI